MKEKCAVTFGKPGFYKSRGTMRKLLFSFFNRFEIFFNKLIGLTVGTGISRIPVVKRIYVLLCKVGRSIYHKLKPKGVVLLHVQGNKMYVDTTDMGVVPLLLKEGVMEKYSTEVFKEMVKESMVVVDVGANIGYFTLIAAQQVGNKGVVYAFEPEPSNFEFLCKNIELNGYTNAVPIQKAVSDRCGTANLWCDKVNFAAPSFSKENVMVFAEERTLGEDNFVEVETVTLDEFLNHTAGNTKVDIIKLDAEGSEGLIIDGAKQTLQTNNLKIIMEFWPLALRNMGTDPIELLHKIQEYGFKIMFINEEKQAVEPIEKIIKFCEKDWIPGGFNLLLEK